MPRRGRGRTGIAAALARGLGLLALAGVVVPPAPCASETTTATPAVDATAVAPSVEIAPRVEMAMQSLAATPLWPAFEPRSIPLAIYDGQATWFFRHPSPPAGCAVTPAAADACILPERHEAMRANTSTTIGGISTATLILPATTPPDSAPRWAAVAIHEAFHVFQRQRHPKWQANEGDLFTYPSDSESLATLVCREMEALRRAIATTDAASAARWATTAVTTRNMRWTAMPASAVVYERASEWNEGLAQYVQDRSLAAAAAPAASPARHSKQRAPSPAASAPSAGAGAPRILRNQEFAADGVRSRVYVSGEALACLLDRFASGWKDSLERDDARPLDALLANALARRGAVAAIFTPDDEAAFRSTGARQVGELRSTRNEARRAFMQRPGSCVVFEAGGEPLWPSGFDPVNVRLLDGGQVLHTRWLALRNGAARIEILDRASLTAPAGTHPLFQGVRRLTVTGLTSAPQIAATDTLTTVRAPGVEASLHGASTETRGDTLYVRLGH
jgi:hypothetical protein